MVFPLCWCWDEELLGVLSVQSQTVNCASETRSFSAFGSQRDSARSVSRLSSPAAFSPLRCSKLEMHFKCLKCLRYFKGIRAKMRRRNQVSQQGWESSGTESNFKGKNNTFVLENIKLSASDPCGLCQKNKAETSRVFVQL